MRWACDMEDHMPDQLSLTKPHRLCTPASQPRTLLLLANLPAALLHHAAQGVGLGVAQPQQALHRVLLLPRLLLRWMKARWEGSEWRGRAAGERSSEAAQTARRLVVFPGPSTHQRRAASTQRPAASGQHNTPWRRRRRRGRPAPRAGSTPAPCRWAAPPRTTPGCSAPWRWRPPACCAGAPPPARGVQGRRSGGRAGGDEPATRGRRRAQACRRKHGGAIMVLLNRRPPAPAWSACGP